MQPEAFAINFVLKESPLLSMSASAGLRTAEKKQ